MELWLPEVRYPVPRKGHVRARVIVPECVLAL